MNFDMDESVNKSTSNEDVEEDSNVITLEEFIEEETRLETDANAVLGPSDDKNCTYSQGYMGRQALYACKTCKDEGSEVAGVCLACTYHCHEGHDFIELYTKRNFRCDCGNSRFKGKKCNLEPKKDGRNCDNKYNDNFEGLYCTCKRPYPDPDDTESDAMIQCIICEDWYHTRHLHADLPPETSYSEMICCDCTEHLPFLNKYMAYSVTKVSKAEDTDVDVVRNGDSSVVNPVICDKSTIGAGENSCVIKSDTRTSDAGMNGECSSSQSVAKSDDTIVPIEDKTPGALVSADGNTSTLLNQGSVDNTSIEGTKKSTGCLLKVYKEVKRDKQGATFWPENFRTLLCSCDSCKDVYRELGVSYILDSGDTVESYEEKGRSSNSHLSDASQHSLDRVLTMLSNIGMDRFSQAEAILNYNELKKNLTEYLAKFVKNKKVVREEDIHEFFTEMKARKRQKMDLPFTCR